MHVLSKLYSDGEMSKACATFLWRNFAARKLIMDIVKCLYYTGSGDSFAQLTKFAQDPGTLASLAADIWVSLEQIRAQRRKWLKNGGAVYSRMMEEQLRKDIVKCDLLRRFFSFLNVEIFHMCSSPARELVDEHAKCVNNTYVTRALSEACSASCASIQAFQFLGGLPDLASLYTTNVFRWSEMVSQRKEFSKYLHYQYYHNLFLHDNLPPPNYAALKAEPAVALALQRGSFFLRYIMKFLAVRLLEEAGEPAEFSHVDRFLLPLMFEQIAYTTEAFEK